MIVEPVIVGVIDEARIESYLFWGSYIVKIGRVLKNPQVVVVLEPRHRGGRTEDGPTHLGKKVWRSATRRAPPSHQESDGCRCHTIQRVYN